MNRAIHIKHETHRNIWVKFSLVLLLFVGYMAYVSYKYGIGGGIHIASLSWSVFVLGTPIAEAGLLIDFPARLLFKVKMLYSELAVWVIAIGLNVYTTIYYPEMYEKTATLKVFKHIIDQPFPFWIIIILSGIGTFLSIKFGDELLDIFKYRDRKYYGKHNMKWKLTLMIFVIGITLVIYDYLIVNLNVSI